MPALWQGRAAHKTCDMRNCYDYIYMYYMCLLCIAILNIIFLMLLPLSQLPPPPFSGRDAQHSRKGKTERKLQCQTTGHRQRRGGHDTIGLEQNPERNTRTEPTTGNEPTTSGHTPTATGPGTTRPGRKSRGVRGGRERRNRTRFPILPSTRGG